MASSVPAGFHALPLPIVELSLAAVLSCGQSFRWTSHPLPTTSYQSSTHEYRLCLSDRVVCLRQSPEFLFYRTALPSGSVNLHEKEAETLVWIRDYFQLDIKLETLYNHWSERDIIFSELRSRFAGIRMLRQDPWENLVSFICSSNNNISRITKMVHSLCKKYSSPLLSLPSPDPSSESASTADTYHPFPPPSALAAPQASATLRSMGFGYRADFIQKTAKLLVDAHGIACENHDMEPSHRWLLSLRSISTAEARVELLKLMGVGRKVADCVLLMSLDKREVVPVDTHVHQIAIKHYGLRVSGKAGAKATLTPKLYEDVNTKFVNIWGEYAGWAHSVRFTGRRQTFSDVSQGSIHCRFEIICFVWPNANGNCP
ncbi:hypothetical protein CONPUDRAFT_48745 [Coniophora puteana RWD-64-598 SS2]|uniref:DNA-(apurinic or apyrimidinic site) lyase n=1 Tax=Coniophora puteana (strain RWD-64-598) TaxID=741705 RepID=A0A5M3N119_CONPW|nr:uncharacterized protein CONPUDRAFT_48745 [Coniophora puteana RWD-64-598 SS2]EIW85082.1 hypothetical protein CONPUDRAFT_48745 [Coniophora puteana RWD-64-598 SS2]